MPNLGIESGRYTRPVTPVASRLCKYCSSNRIDDEQHAILECNTFFVKRNCFLGKMIAILPRFEQMSPEHRLLTILCPSNVKIALFVSKYLKIITETRRKLDQGLSNTMLTSYCKIQKVPSMAYIIVVLTKDLILHYWDKREKKKKRTPKDPILGTKKRSQRTKKILFSWH